MTEDIKMKRIEKLKQNKKIREELPLESDKTIRECQKGMDHLKDICEKASRAKDLDQKVNEIYDKYFTPNEIEGMPDHLWSEHERLASKDATRLGNLKKFNYDIENETQQLGSLDSTAQVFYSSTAINTASYIDVAKAATESGEEFITSDALKILIEETHWNDVDFIKKELTKITPSVLEDFKDVVNDWNSKEESKKDMVLLSLRSVIFHRLLDKVSQESDFGKLLWSKNAQKGTVEPRLRFRQVKYFILGNRDEASIPISTLDSINNTAKELKLYFDNMSGFGKKGDKEFIFVDSCYRETISSFANALRLKSELDKISC